MSNDNIEPPKERTGLSDDVMTDLFGAGFFIGLVMIVAGFAFFRDNQTVFGTSLMAFGAIIGSVCGTLLFISKNGR